MNAIIQLYNLLFLRTIYTYKMFVTFFFLKKNKKIKKKIKK
jgi:hypothetical protein